jgi:hypothetical protein
MVLGEFLTEIISVSILYIALQLTDLLPVSDFKKSCFMEAVLGILNA